MTNELKPAGGYKWPDAEPGNLIALKHGAESPRVINEVATVLVDAVVEHAPWLTDPVFEDAVWRYCRAEARARLLNNHIFAVAEEHPERIPVRLWESASSSDRTASKLAEALGLTPQSRAVLQAIVTSTAASEANLDALQERGREIRSRRAVAVDALPDDEDACRT